MRKARLCEPRTRASGSTERHYAAPVSADSRQRRSSTQISAQTGGPAELVTALAGQANARLAKISPHLTQHHLAALVTAYKQGVAALQAHCWLTAARADTLDSMARTVQA